MRPTPRTPDPRPTVTHAAPPRVLLRLAVVLTGLVTPLGDASADPPNTSSALAAPPHPQNATAEAASLRGRVGSVTPIPVPDSVRARPLATGGRGWLVELPGRRPLATPAVSDEIVFVGGGFGSHEFYALDVRTGSVRWAIRASDDGPTGAVVDRGHVVFNTESCTLFVLRADTGQMVWSRWLGDPLMSQPAVADGRVYMAYPSGGEHRLAAFALETGAPLWERPIAGDVITAPVVVGDSVYAATNEGKIYRFAAADGRVVFARDERVTSAPWVVGDRVFVAMHDEVAGDARPVEGHGWLHGQQGTRAQGAGASWARRSAAYLDSNVQEGSSYRQHGHTNDSNVGFGSAPATARITQANQNLGRRTVHELWEYQGSRPLVVGGVSYSTMGDVLRAVDVADGHVLWDHALAGDLARDGGHLGAPPVWAGDRLLVATLRGDVIAIDPRTGQETARWTTGETIRSQPAVMGGRIFVGTTAGRVVMVDTGDASLDGWAMWGGSGAHQLATPEAPALAAAPRPPAGVAPGDGPAELRRQVRWGSAALGLFVVGAALGAWAGRRRARAGAQGARRHP